MKILAETGRAVCTQRESQGGEEERMALLKEVGEQEQRSTEEAEREARHQLHAGTG